jgi:hypothetical protein
MQQIRAMSSAICGCVPACGFHRPGRPTTEVHFHVLSRGIAPTGVAAFAAQLGGMLAAAMLAAAMLAAVRLGGWLWRPADPLFGQCSLSKSETLANE